MRYGLLFSIVIITLCTAGALWNLEMFLRSYPPDIKQKYGPMSKKSQKQLIVFAIPVYLSVLGVLTGSTMDLASTCGKLEFLPVLLNDWIVLNLFNLIDLLILDWLVFVTLQPSFVILPGTKEMAGYKDYGFHFRGYLKGILYTSIASLIAGAITILFR
jgi:hypothetical protein